MRSKGKKNVQMGSWGKVKSQLQRLQVTLKNHKTPINNLKLKLQSQNKILHRMEYSKN